MQSPAVTAVLKALDGCDLRGLRIVIESAEAPAEKSIFKKIAAKKMPVIKTQEERYVLGVVLEPLKEMGQKDAQNDLYSAEEVRTACYKFMEEFQNVGLQHQEYVNGSVKILENWITRDDTTISGQAVAKGTWLMGMRVVDDEIWSAIKKGDITGLSIGGFAQRDRVQ